MTHFGSISYEVGCPIKRDPKAGTKVLLEWSAQSITVVRLRKVYKIFCQISRKKLLLSENCVYFVQAVNLLQVIFVKKGQRIFNHGLARKGHRQDTDKECMSRPDFGTGSIRVFRAYFVSSPIPKSGRDGECFSCPAVRDAVKRHLVAALPR